MGPFLYMRAHLEPSSLAANRDPIQLLCVSLVFESKDLREAGEPWLALPDSPEEMKQSKKKAASGFLVPIEALLSAAAPRLCMLKEASEMLGRIHQNSSMR